MRTTAAWARWRRLQYYSAFGVMAALSVVAVYLIFFYSAATCFDGVLNGDETGVDCGGSCVRICPFEVSPPQVQWARSFEITKGQYNAVAYVENRNPVAATPELTYTFSLYDDAGLITERTGTTVLPPDSVYPIFEGRIMTGDRVPTRTFLEIEEPEFWIPATHGRNQFTLVERTLRDVDSAPRLDAVIRNNNLTEVRQVEVVATIFDRQRNALTSSRTTVENFAPRSETNIVFTWPQPIAKTIRSCEIPTDVVVAIDLSGSMNDDGGTPPEPVTSVLNAAEQFVSRLNADDQAAVVTFASDAVTVTELTTNTTLVGDTIANLVIAPREETGSTNTGDAFVRATEILNSAQHSENARKVLVLLTDGLANAPGDEPEAYAIDRAERLQALDTTVYTIGLGKNVNYAFVEQVATSPEHAFRALTIDDVDRIYQQITSAICEEGPAVIEIIPKTEASFKTVR